jgi:cation:H+ antiporter
MIAWLQFMASATVVVVAGTKLSHYGNRIADLTGLGGLWIGVVLMAAATSLPEVFTGISAALMNAPDLAAGELFGSNMANMLILGLIDMIHRQKRIWQQAAFEHTLIATLAMGLTGLAGAFMMFRSGPGHGGVGADSLLLVTVYLLGMRVVYRQEDVHRHQKELERVVEVNEPSVGNGRRAKLTRASIGFALATFGIVVAAPYLAASANDLAEQTGIGTTVVGTSLLALTTSLPELVVALAAIRLGAFDLAVGNLFGSNAFNIAALFLVDMAYRDQPLLSVVSSTHVFTALWSILLMNIGLMGIIYRAERRFILIEPDSFLMVATYILGMWVLFHLGG